MSNSEAFLSAIRSGDASRVEALLDETPALASAGEGGVSAVLLAAYHGHPSIAQSIARRCADLSIHEVCAIGDESRAMALAAADHTCLDSPGGDGHYPLGLAIFFRHPALARKLIEAGASIHLQSGNLQRVAPVHAATAVCDRETLELLLMRGADANARQQMDYAPLHDAAGRGDFEIARLLLAHGALRDVRTADGKTPADCARERGHQDFAGWVESR